MVSSDFFIEMFPIEAGAIPELATYQVVAEAPLSDVDSLFLTQRLRRTFAGVWLWDDGYILTDSPVLSAQMDVTLDLLHDQLPRRFGQVHEIKETHKRRPHPQIVAHCVQMRLVSGAVEQEIAAMMRRSSVTLKQAVLDRHAMIHPWAVDAEPACSISIQSILRHDRTLQAISEQSSPDDLIGLEITDPLAPAYRGVVVKVAGTVAEQRVERIEDASDSAISDLFKSVADHVLVLYIDDGQHIYPYPADSLYPRIRVVSDDWERFNVDAQKGLRLLRVPPDERAALIRKVSDILKQAGMIGNAFNTRTHDHLFASTDFVPGVVFGQNRAVPHTANLPLTMQKSGIYHAHKQFKNQPIRIAVINAIDDEARDFVEALRRELEKHYPFAIELIKERRLRVVSPKNVESAVKVVEAEDPHIVLGFFEDPIAEEDPAFAHLKSITLGKGIATLPVYRSVMHHPESMSRVIMGLLAKTGNTPYALAEPLDYADYVVGLQLLRVAMSGNDRVVACARIYTNSGEFINYVTEIIDLKPDEKLPLTCIQALLPKKLFSGQRVIIHHDGFLPIDHFRLLVRWATEIKARFYPVEIYREDIPRLYQLDGGIKRAPWGSMFALADTEAFVITAPAHIQETPSPLHIRVFPGALNIGQATYSVLAWSLLHYGINPRPTEPVTIQHADELLGWLSRGMLPLRARGEIPFWL